MSFSGQVLLWALLLIGCLGMAACAALRTGPVQKGWLHVGDLALPWPQGWKLLRAPLHAQPSNRDPECDCSRFGPLASNDLHPGLAAGLGMIWTGRDTLVLDTVQMALWPGDCAEPCYLAYDSLAKAGGLKAVYAAEDQLVTALRGKTIYHRVLPSLDIRPLGDHLLLHVNGSILQAGRSGLYEHGSPQRRPFAIYGLDLHPETIEQLRVMMKKAVVRD